MGRIVSSVTIANISDESNTIRCDALVDTNASLMMLPGAWKDRLGNLQLVETSNLKQQLKRS